MDLFFFNFPHSAVCAMAEAVFVCLDVIHWRLKWFGSTCVFVFLDLFILEIFEHSTVDCGECMYFS